MAKELYNKKEIVAKKKPKKKLKDVFFLRGKGNRLRNKRQGRSGY